MLAKKHSFTYPAANHQNAANLGLQSYEKTNGLSLWHSTGVNFSPRNNVSNFGSFAKVSVPVETIEQIKCIVASNPIEPKNTVGDKSNIFYFL